MATKYKLTYLDQKYPRWRKRHKGNEYYFQRRPNETKEESYYRCWRLWQEKLAEIQSRHHRYEDALAILIRRKKDKLAYLQSEDTFENRKEWRHICHELQCYQWYFANGVNPWFGDDVDYDNPPELLNAFPNEAMLADQPAPWGYRPPVLAHEEKTISAAVERFLAEFEQKVERGERSADRYEACRRSLAVFTKYTKADSLEDITSQLLHRFQIHLESNIGTGPGKVSDYTARDRLGILKQFVNWLYQQELIEQPRIVQSRDFNITVEQKAPEVFTDAEVQTLLRNSTDTTRLYLLLMLNTGMQQADIAGLLQSEVNWKAGSIERKRSKLANNRRLSKNAKTVAYQLWPETFALLKEHRSKDEQLALTNSNGTALRTTRIVNGKTSKTDNIKSAWRRLQQTLENNGLGIGKPMKLLRKTAATKIGEHPEYGKFVQHFLGQTPSTIAERHYVVPSREQFDDCVAWLRTALPISNPEA